MRHTTLRSAAVSGLLLGALVCCTETGGTVSGDAAGADATVQTDTPSGTTDDTLDTDALTPDALAPDALPGTDAGLDTTGSDPDTQLADTATPDAGSDIIGSEDAGGTDTNAPDSGDTSSPETPALVVNEIMYNPKNGASDSGEWVEIYNPTDAPVDLMGWTLKDKTSAGHVIATSTMIPAMGYVVLGRGSDPSTNGGIVPAYVYQDFYLGNSGDSVILVAPDGTEVDTVSYGAESPWPDQLWGVSLELVAVDADNTLPSNWAPAVATFGAGDLGTPGFPNGETVPAFELIDGKDDWHSVDAQADLLFAPHDDLQDRVLVELAAATTSVRMAFFNVRLNQVLWALEDLMADGVTVDVLLDARQQEQDFNTMAEDMMAKGIPVTLVANDNAEDATMHHKFTIIDGERVMTGSANYSYTALNVSDEDLLIIDSMDLADRFGAEFDELKSGADDETSPSYTGDPPVQAWMGPEDDLDGKILDLVENAQSQILVAMFQLNQSGLVDALIAAHVAGKQVVVVLDQKFLATGGAEITLAEAGVPLILATNSGSESAEMHSKLLIVDGTTIAMGSYNWTNLASFHNDEGLLIIDDPALAMRATGQFATLVTSYHPGSPSLLGFSPGDRQVTFQIDNLQLAEGATASMQLLGSGESLDLDGTSLTTTLAAGTRVHYRYSVTGPSGVVSEGGASHSFAVPFADGPFTVVDVFRP